MSNRGSLSRYFIVLLLPFFIKIYNFQTTQFSRSVVTDSLRPHESQHVRPPCPSPAPRVYSDPCPSSRWCHPAISSSVVPFSSCSQSLPASGPFQTARLFQIKKFPNTFTFSKIFNIQEFAPTYFICWEKKITLQCFMQRFFLDEDIESLQNIFSWNLFALYILGKKEKNLNSECKFHSKFHCQSAFYIFLSYLYLLWHPTTQLWPNSDLNSCNDLLNGLFFTIMRWLIKFLLFPLFSLLASISFHLFQMWTEFLRTRAISKLLFM